MNTAIEIDFLIRRENKLIPIEVKSLLKLKEMFKGKIGTLYVLHEGDFKIEDTIVYLPYYMAFIL